MSGAEYRGIAEQFSIFLLSCVKLAFNCRLKYVWAMHWKITRGWMALKTPGAVFQEERGESSKRGFFCILRFQCEVEGLLYI